MAFPIGNAITIQGMSLLIGSLFGPSFLSIFNTYRTLSRVLVQLIASISRSLWPEISRLYANGEQNKIKKIVRLGTLGMVVSSSWRHLFVFFCSDYFGNLDAWKNRS